MNQETFIKEITKTPDPETMGGLYYQRVYIDKYNHWCTKIYKKAIVGGKLKYIFDSVYRWR